MMNSEELQVLADKISATLSINSKSILSIDEAASYLQMAKSTLYKKTMSRQIPFYRPCGKLIYFDRAELEAWVLENRIATDDELRSRARTILNRRKGVRS